MAGEAMHGGEWRTLRNPPAPQEARDALGAITKIAATEARAGHWRKAQEMKAAIDLLHDFLTYEPKTHNGNITGKETK